MVGQPGGNGGLRLGYFGASTGAGPHSRPPEGTRRSVRSSRVAGARPGFYACRLVTASPACSSSVATTSRSSSCTGTAIERLTCLRRLSSSPAQRIFPARPSRKSLGWPKSGFINWSSRRLFDDDESKVCSRPRLDYTGYSFLAIPPSIDFNGNVPCYYRS